MKHIDIIRPGSINAINGPIGTLKRILKNRLFFSEREYDITLFTNDSIKQGPIIAPPTTMAGYSRSKGLRRMASDYLRAGARRRLLPAIIINKKDRRNAARLVDYYLSLERNPDIVQMHSDAECYHYLKKRKNTSAKVVLFLHTDGFPQKMLLESLPGLSGSRYLKRLTKRFNFTIEHIDRLVFITNVAKKNFVESYTGKSLPKISVILNGIDDLSSDQNAAVHNIAEQARQSEFKYRLCCSGTINTRKGQRTIVEALIRLPEHLRNKIHVDFIGDGSERHALQELAEKYGISQNCLFRGSVPNSDVYKCLAENNIFVLMSKNEGLPISIIEAMRVGLPIIATNVSGIPEQVTNGENGFLIEPTTDALVEMLTRLPDYDWEAMGRASRQRFERDFTFERMQRQFCEMYDESLKQ